MELGAADVTQHARVILHIDLDCFYCQVEQERLSIPREVPCAVQQWEGLIAINYAARAAGVTRHMRVQEAKQKLPNLVTVHVQTIGGEADEAQEGAQEGGGNSSRSTQKACLERYRTASSRIIALLHKLAPQAIVEKASIDEVYMDVTAAVDAELRSRPPPSPAVRDGTEGLDAFAWGSIVVGGPLNVENEFDRRLSVGASIACRLRGQIFQQLGYTASAGVACNKLLAKIGSAMNKPNRQTLVPPRAVAGLMAEMPLGKIRNFGGKLGGELQALGCATAGQVRALGQAALEREFGEQRAAAILLAVSGISHEPVQEREKPKSMLAAKSFEPTSDLGAIQRWLGILAQELAGRMANDEAQHQRRARTLVLSYSGTHAAGWSAGGRSKSCPMPRQGRQGPSATALAEAALGIFHKVPNALPCSRLAMSAVEFAPTPVTGERSIQHFFAATEQRSGAGQEGGAGDEDHPGSSEAAAEAGASSRGGPQRVSLAASPIAALFASAQQKRGERTQAAEPMPQQHGEASGGGARAHKAPAMRSISQFFDAAKQQPDMQTGLSETSPAGVFEPADTADGAAGAASATTGQASKAEGPTRALTPAALQQPLPPHAGPLSEQAQPAASLSAQESMQQPCPRADASVSERRTSHAEAAAGVCGDLDMDDIDVEQQKRILHEIHVRRAALDSSGGAGAGQKRTHEVAGNKRHKAAAIRTVDPKQRSIAGLFAKSQTK